MSTKKIDSRISLKHDTEANWIKATNFTPLIGEIIIYDIDNNHNYERIKIGDGITNINALPFQGADIELITLSDIDEICSSK